MTLQTPCPKCGATRDLEVPEGCPAEIAEAIGRITVCPQCSKRRERSAAYSRRRWAQSRQPTNDP
jgi:hypothetical protein